MGFRPFFILATLAGIILPVLWAQIFNGVMAPPTHSFAAIRWHAHEMYFGFGLAVLGGFLLTATKNWVKVRGFYGRYLIFLVFAWLFERIGMFFGGNWPPILFVISNYMFLATLILMLLWTLIKNRKTDSYKDNILFILILPLFLISKYFMLSLDYFELGTSLSNGLFRIAFLIMLERTLTQFMKNTFQVQILRNFILDTSIKLFAFCLLLDKLLVPKISSAMILILTLLLCLRFIFWKPRWAFRRLDIGIMYLGYLALVLQLFLMFLSRIQHWHLVGSVITHVFTMGVMGLIIPAMMIRICNGHTGRKVNFDRRDKAVLKIMMLAFIFRVVAPQFFAAQYVVFIYAAALCWLAGFLLLAGRYIPILLEPRIDGKES